MSTLLTNVCPAPESYEDLMLWADGTFCYRSQLSEMSHMSDDYEVLPFESAEWNALIGTQYEQGVVL